MHDSDDDDGKKSPTMAEKMLTLYRTGQYVEPRPHVELLDAGVATIDLDFDAPDDVIDVVPEPSGVTVELVEGYDDETLVKLSDASLDRLAAERASRSRTPSQSIVEPPAESFDYEPSCEAPCTAPCADPCSAPCSAPCSVPCVPEPCSVPMVDAPCDPSPCVRCSRSLERVGFACPTPCAAADAVCPVPSSAAGDGTVSTADVVCQTEPTWSTSRSSRTSRTASSSMAAGDTNTDTGTDMEDMYNEDTNDVSCNVFRAF